MREIATCWYPGGNKTGLAKCWAQCLACGKYSVHEGVTFPHTPYPTPTIPVYSSLCCRSPAGLRVLFSTFHSPARSQPVTGESGSVLGIKEGLGMTGASPSLLRKPSLHTATGRSQQPKL